MRASDVRDPVHDRARPLLLSPLMREPRGVARVATAPPDPNEVAVSGHLRYVTDAAPGIMRLRAGKGFRYRAADGSPVRAPQTLTRIRSLAIPPAWTDVWICALPNGHIQAVGRDARGRKQYRYHPRWREVRDETKYARLAAFARALPRIRRRRHQDVRRAGLPREKVLATVIGLLETTLIRVGNEEYARQNGSYGLTTLRARHVKVTGARMRFEFVGKGGKPHVVDLDDRRLAQVVRQCRELPGHELFQYVDDHGHRQTIDSADVNAYLREIAGQDFTAKDFRTWGGTLIAAIAFAERPSAESETEAKSTVAAVMRTVGERLGNTPAVARVSYVSPAVVEQYLDGQTIDDFRPRHLRVVRARETGLNPEEQGLVSLLRSWRIRRARKAA
jgi:DNA topoisomerase-1